MLLTIIFITLLNHFPKYLAVESAINIEGISTFGNKSTSQVFVCSLVITNKIALKEEKGTNRNPHYADKAD